VLLRGISGGKEVTSRRIVTSVGGIFNSYADWQGLLAVMADPTLKYVVSNTTEAGIAYVPEAYTPGTTPTGFPAKVTALLHERFKTLGGGAGSGLVFLPCELIEANGTNLRTIVLRHAREWELEADFVRWIEEDTVFLNTLVDRVVSGYPKDEAPELFKSFGYEDPLLVTAEPFHVWVIEGPKQKLAQLSAAFPLDRAGLDVVWTDDLQPYRTRKVRILNGAHTSSALAAYSAGIDTVGAMVEDQTLSRYLRKVMFDEIVPCVPLPEAERKAYADTIIERFANPFIRHALISISLNSVSKWKVRVLPTLKDYLAAKRSLPPCLTFSLSALLNFYHGTPAEDGSLTGHRENGEAYAVKDDAAALKALSSAWEEWEGGHDTSRLVHSVLSRAELWGEDLTALEGFADSVTKNLDSILKHGIRATVSGLLEGSIR
jgi:tagaturonate reductase